MNKIAKVFRVVMAAAAAGTLVLLGASFAPTLLGYESFIVSSGSMGRANPVGSVAVTRMVDARTIRTGDVVSFQTESASRITHRVIAVTEENGQRVFETKGDANLLPDPEPLRLTSGKVARVEWSVPYAGHLVRHVRTPAGGLLLFALPILGLLLDRRKRARPHSASRLADSQVVGSNLILPCPHCRESVHLSIVPPQPEPPVFSPKVVLEEVTDDYITLPKVSLPEPEVVAAYAPSLVDGDSGSQPKGYREWNFPLELSNNGSVSKNGGSRHA